MNPKTKSDLLLLLAAAIWGFAFVAQRMGMDYVGPFTYNGVRFSLGFLVLLPYFLYRRKKKSGDVQVLVPASRGLILGGSLLTGLLLFGGVGLQQLGLQHTTAGKAGFITGLYVAFVPVAGLLWGHKSRWFIWVGVALSMSGLYFLSISRSLQFAPGDFQVFLCAVIFTFHVLLIGWLSPRMDSISLAMIQFGITAVLNLIVAFLTEIITIQSILEAWLPICYGGILSVGIAYTLQIVAQKTAHPAYVSIILGLESLFAVIGGILILDEHLTGRMVAGCALMLAGSLLVQQKSESGHQKKTV